MDFHAQTLAKNRVKYLCLLCRRFASMINFNETVPPTIEGRKIGFQTIINRSPGIIYTGSRGGGKKSSSFALISPHHFGRIIQAMFYGVNIKLLCFIFCLWGN